MNLREILDAKVKVIVDEIEKTLTHPNVNTHYYCVHDVMLAKLAVEALHADGLFAVITSGKDSGAYWKVHGSVIPFNPTKGEDDA